MLLPQLFSSSTTLPVRYSELQKMCSDPKEGTSENKPWREYGDSHPWNEDNTLRDDTNDTPTSATAVTSSDDSTEASAHFWHQLGFPFASSDDNSGHIGDSNSVTESRSVGSAGISHFQHQVARVVDYAVTEKIKHEMLAKALLAELIAQQAQQQQPVSQEYLQKVGRLVDSYKVLEKYVANMTNVLTSMAREVDEKKNHDSSQQWRSATQLSAVGWLQREMDGANRSSAFLVVLSDIYEVVRVAAAANGGEAPSSSSKWVAPTSFQRSTSKYW